MKYVPRVILHETISFSIHTADSAWLSRAAELAKLCPLPEPEGMSACTEPLLDCVLNGKLPPDDSFTICKWLGLGTPAMAPLLAKTLADLACGAPLTLTGIGCTNNQNPLTFSEASSWEIAKLDALTC